MRRGKLLALLLAGTLALSNIAVVSASDPTSEGQTTSKQAASEEGAEQDKSENQGSPTAEEPEESQGDEADYETGKEPKEAEDPAVISKDEKDPEISEEVTNDDSKDIVSEQSEEADDPENTERLAEDRVQIPDKSLQEELSNNGVMVDEDGTVSRADMERIMALYISGKENLDLTGIEAAVNLRNLSVSNCDISDLSFMEKLPNLVNLDVCGNQIKDFTVAFAICGETSNLRVAYEGNPQEGIEQIFRKFAYQDLKLQEGQSSQGAFSADQKPVLGDTVFQDTSKVEYTGFDEQIIAVKDGKITAKKAGETKVTAKYGNAETSFTVTVQGVGAAVVEDEKVSAGELPEDIGYQSVLNKGQLWNWENDTVQKISGDKKIQSFVSYWVYRPKNTDSKDVKFREEYFGLDADGTLWSIMKHYDDETEYTQYKIAEHVSQVVYYGGKKALYITESGECYLGYVEDKQVNNQLICKDAQSVNDLGYVRKKDGSVIRVLNDDEGKIVTEKSGFEGVESGSYYMPGENGTSYSLMLDNEGNLWRKPYEGDWEKEPYVTGVSALSHFGYLKNGTVYSLEDHSVIAENVKEMYNGTSYSASGYLSTDGTYYVLRNDGFVKVLSGVKQVVRSYALDEKNDLYYVDDEGDLNPVLVMRSVVKISLSNDDIIAQREDGSIWRMDQRNSVAPKLLCTLDQISTSQEILVDKQSGITVSGVEKGVTLEVEALTKAKEAEIQSKLEQMIREGAVEGIQGIKDILFFDITLKKDGVEYHPGTSVQVTIPIPEGFSKNLAVFHQKSDNSLERMEITVHDASVSFMTESFSPYAIADLGEDGISGKPGTGVNAGTGANGNTGKDVSKKAPKTGDTASVVLYMVLILSAFAVSMRMMRRKLYR